jgi:hypothetical protein
LFTFVLSEYVKFFWIFVLQEASHPQVASAATISVAFMEALSTAFENFSRDYR